MFSKVHDFIDATPNAMRCAKNVAAVLQDNGFVEYYETEHWDKPDETVKGIYVIRGGSIIAISLPSEINHFAGTITHSDSPHFKIKTNPEIIVNGYTKLNVEPYGGAIYYSWLDKPLAICGMAIDDSGKYIEVDTKNRHSVFIPSQAIHINREVNSSNNLNPQKDMLPVWGLGKDNSFLATVTNEPNAKDTILAYDLSLYNPEPVKTVQLGSNKVIMGPRLDNLASVHAALIGFLNAESAPKYVANVLAVFNSEEIGSMTYDGANGTFLTSVLERVCEMYNLDKHSTFARSSFLSIDAAHAVHPNAPEKSDPTNIVEFDKGVVVKHNINYANNLELETDIKEICRNHGIKYQDFYSRADMRCGATLGNISMSQHGIATIDIGIPMLAMHSAVETVMDDDLYQLKRLVYYYYWMQ